MKRYCVWSPIFTPPEHGARFVVEDGLTKDEAQAAAVRRNELAEKHHAKGGYVAGREDEEPPATEADNLVRATPCSDGTPDKEAS